MTAYRVLFWLCLSVSVACFAAGGWLWWHDRDVPLLVVDEPLLEVGAVTRGQTRTIEIAVTNTSSYPVRLAGLDGELC